MPSDRPSSSITRRARLIAFYLPQYYPIPENDRWWGPGFTEWTSVAGAQALFRGHRQPRIPADLGFYDLRVPETRIAQAELAARHGIEGFCYWHYWFGGKRLLERPFDEVLHSGEPDFPFCLGWANQPWTDTWLGTGRVLQEQRYSPDDDVRHARWLLEAFADDRYLRVAGRPLFLVYKPGDLPDPARAADTLRGEAARAGLPEPFLLGIDAFKFGHDFRTDGFDGTVSFEPGFSLLPHMNQTPTLSRPWRKLSRAVRNVRLGVWSSTLKAYDYRFQRRQSQQRRASFSHPFFPTLLVGWDNTPRRGKSSIILRNDEPRHFEAGLAELIEAAATVPFDDRVIFVNAWNEWAEGNYLEPDLDDGPAKLEAIRRLTLVDQQAPIHNGAGGARTRLQVTRS
jgi:lipopolysaccharide biosynthesis protein